MAVSGSVVDGIQADLQPKILQAATGDNADQIARSETAQGRPGLPWQPELVRMGGDGSQSAVKIQEECAPAPVDPLPDLRQSVEGPGWVGVGHRLVDLQDF